MFTYVRLRQANFPNNNTLKYIVYSILGPVDSLYKVFFGQDMLMSSDSFPLTVHRIIWKASVLAK